MRVNKKIAQVNYEFNSNCWPGGNIAYNEFTFSEDTTIIDITHVLTNFLPTAGDTGVKEEA